MAEQARKLGEVLDQLGVDFDQLVNEYNLTRETLVWAAEHPKMLTNDRGVFFVVLGGGHAMYEFPSVGSWGGPLQGGIAVVIRHPKFQAGNDVEVALVRYA